MSDSDVQGTPPEILRARRGGAYEALGGGALVLPAAPARYRSRDGEHRYVPDRELFYLTGATEPGSVAVAVGGDEPRLALFVRERDAEAELWSGVRLGTEGAAERFAPDECYPLARLDQELPKLLAGADRIFFRLGRGDEIERHVFAALQTARARGARTGSGPRAVVDPGEILDELRVRKDDHEIALLRRAVGLTVEGHRAGARVLRPGAGEWAVEAAVNAAFRAGGGGGTGFETIVGTGAHACVLHYVDNSARIESGDLVLVDAGAEYRLYHGDVTRTYPAGGRFGEAQRVVYEIVDRARRSAIEAVTPGAVVSDVHAAAVRVLVEGLVDLGALSGDLEELVATEAYKPFYPHQTSHWLGLDVHDPGDYARHGVSRALEPRMVLTVEPGLYFQPDREGTPPRLAGIGVRIEDDVLVTPDGHDVLSAGLPTAAGEVEALVEGSG